MGLLHNLEARLNQIVNGSFSKAFKAEVQPVELGAALQQELDNHAALVNGQVVVPNVFSIELSPTDFGRLNKYFGTLSTELSVVVSNYGAEQRYSALGRPDISFGRGDNLDTGVFRIRSESKEVAAQAVPAFVNPDLTSQIPVAVFTQSVTPTLTSVDGQEFRLTNSVTNIGRGEEADIRVDDNSVSRIHCAVILGTDVLVRDLGSTNGTMVDGVIASESALRDGSIIKIGNTTLTYAKR